MVLDWIFAEKLVLFALSTTSVTFCLRVLNLFVDGEFRLEPTSLCLPTLPFQLAELLRDTAEPECRLPRTGCATAEGRACRGQNEGGYCSRKQSYLVRKCQRDLV